MRIRLPIEPTIPGLPHKAAKLWRATCVEFARPTLPMLAKWTIGVGVIMVLLCLVYIEVFDKYYVEPVWWVWVMLSATALNVFGAIIAARHFHRTKRARRDQELATGRFLNCIVCHYDLHGTTNERCSECGASALIDDWRRDPDAAAKPASTSPSTRNV